MGNSRGAGQRVWVASELYYPEETSSGDRLTRIAEGLARRFDVGALCAQPTYSKRGVRAPRRERHDDVDIRRSWSTRLNKDKLPLRLVNIVTISVSLFLDAVRVLRRDDVVIVMTNPPTLPFMMVAACRLRRARCVVLIHDLYPEALISTGTIRGGGIVDTLLSWLTPMLYRSAARIVVLGEDVRESVLRRCPAKASDVVVIPNFTNAAIVPSPKSESTILNELGLQERFIVQYSGNMGRTHDLESVLAAASVMRDTKDVHFLLVGAGARWQWLNDAMAEAGLDNVTVRPLYPKSRLSDLLSACDVSLITTVPGMAGVSVPGRIYDVLQSGRPTIAMIESESEVARVIEGEGVGWVVPPADVEGLVAAIEAARSDLPRLAGMGIAARAAAERSYTSELTIGRYQDLVADVIDEHD